MSEICLKKNESSQYHCIDPVSQYPLFQYKDEFKIKFDLISKIRTLFFSSTSDTLLRLTDKWMTQDKIPITIFTDERININFLLLNISQLQIISLDLSNPPVE